MPKSVFISDSGNESVGVHWYNFPERKPDPVEPVVSVSVRNSGTDETLEQRLFFSFTTPEKIDQFVAELEKAKRKVFER
jgi:hypothetical protein